MHMLNSVSRKDALLVPLWIQLKEAMHLVEPTSTPMQPMQMRSEQKRPAWSMQERLLLIACMLKESTTTLSELIILIIATLMSHWPHFNGCLFGELKLCQT
jgi:hypothetical protein